MTQPSPNDRQLRPYGRALIGGLIAGIAAGLISSIFAGIAGFIIGFIVGAIVGSNTALMVSRARETA